jgi:two-component system, OmpR family, phosphate regulon sensor histidine kinase PhoR
MSERSGREQPMTDTSEATNARRLARLVSGRLRHSRWLLVAAVAGAILIHAAGGGSLLLTAGIIAALFAVAAIAPRRLKRRAAAEALAPAGPRLASDLSAASLAAAVADPLIVFDTRGAVVLANSAAASAFGDMNVGISLPLKFRAPEIQLALERVLSGHSVSETTEYTERVPFERVFKVTATPIGNGSGLFVVVFEDRSEARRIDRMRADFIANASHELRTPLASIAGFVETLRGPARNDVAARDQFLQIMQNQTARMARLIDDLLSLSRLEMKALSIGSATVDLVGVISGVIETLRPLAADVGVTIENKIDATKAEVSGDRDELFQVFENLVENACKYGSSGGRVELSLSRSADEISIQVRDFGHGISEEHLPRITERFYRVDVESSRSQKGTGLGLSIVKHIVTRHRGRLTISSQAGEGAAFTVHLPIA